MNWTIGYKAIAYTLFALVLIALPACGGGSGSDASDECIEALEEVEGWEVSLMDLVKSKPVSDWSDDALVQSAFLFSFAYGDTVNACQGLMNKIDEEGQRR